VSNQALSDGGPALFSMARRLVHSWWQGDRIRVSPTTGKLLRLRPPCCLCVGGQYVEVLDRTIQEGAPAVLYGCRTRAGMGSLRVELVSSAAGVAVEWREGGQVVRLKATDVDVFGH
jgi:hypothetical protein